jgi:hypothetical protein
MEWIVDEAAKLVQLEKQWKSLLGDLPNELLMTLVGISDDALLEAMEECGVYVRHGVDPEQLPFFRDKLRDMAMAEARERAKRGVQ